MSTVKWTGIDNEVILSNLRHMAQIKVPVTVRVPLIPGFNADRKEPIRHCALRSRAAGPGSKRISVLPYHALGKPKYASLGRPYPMDGEKTLSPDKVRELTHILEAEQLEVSIGS
jgi:pyruvate formate lyase activating enzyme